MQNSARLIKWEDRDICTVTNLTQEERTKIAHLVRNIEVPDGHPDDDPEWYWITITEQPSQVDRLLGVSQATRAEAETQRAEEEAKIAEKAEAETRFLELEKKHKVAMREIASFVEELLAQGYHGYKSSSARNDLPPLFGSYEEAEHIYMRRLDPKFVTIRGDFTRACDKCGSLTYWWSGIQYVHPETVDKLNITATPYEPPVDPDWLPYHYSGSGERIWD